MKVRTLECEAFVCRITEARQLLELTGREVRSQTLAPSSAEDRLEKIGLIRRAQGCDALDNECAHLNVAQSCPLQQANNCANRGEVMLL